MEIYKCQYTDDCSSWCHPCCDVTRQRAVMLKVSFLPYIQQGLQSYENTGTKISATRKAVLLTTLVITTSYISSLEKNVRLWSLKYCDSFLTWTTNQHSRLKSNMDGKCPHSDYATGWTFHGSNPVGTTEFELFGAGIFFKILAHPVFKMRILQEPKKIALWNKRHLEEREKKTENVQHVQNIQ